MRIAPLLVALLLVPLSSPCFAEDEPTPGVAPRAIPDAAAPGPSEAERARIKELVGELRHVTSEIRGLAWKQPVEADLLTREQMMAYMKDSIKEELDPVELERMTRILRRLGMLDADQDPLQIAMDMITSMAGGFFNPKTKKLYLLAGQDPESQKPTIVHELLHALEDQYIDLQKRQDKLKDDSDALFAFKCMIEGSAETARMIYEAKDPEAARMQMAGQRKNKELMEGQKRTFANTPAFMMLDTLLHYKTGPNFVQQALAGRSYRENIDALYAAAPTTQEQLLHPDKWLGAHKDLPQKIEWAKPLADVLGDGWTQLYDMPQGELDLALWLDFYLGPDDGKLSMSDMRAGTYVAADAHRAAEGWDGGRMVFLQSKEQQIAVGTAFAFDSKQDAEEAYDVFEQTLVRMNGTDWTEGTSSGGPGGNASLNYVGAYGPGRLARIGTAVLWLDGLEDAELERAWPSFARTRFTPVEGDTWTRAAAADPFAGCEIAWRDTGVAWDLPEDWAVNEQAAEQMRPADANFVGQVSRAVSADDGSALGSVQIVLRVVNQGMAKGVMPDVIKNQIARGAGFAEDRLHETTVAGLEGYAYDLVPAGAPQVIRAIVVSTGLRTLIILVRGPSAAVARIEASLPDLWSGIKLVHVY